MKVCLEKWNSIIAP